MSALEDLDQLYTKILQEALPKTKSTNSKEHKREFCRHFTVVVGSAVSLFSSLSVSSLAKLLSLEQDDINFTLNSLWSIISVPQKSNATISLLHPSFRDFLLDQTRCTDLDFWVDSAERHVGLTGSCLKLMAGSLKRDICDLKMPGTLINEIFPERIQEHIIAELEYACTYWVRHLESSVPSANSILERDLLDRIRRFLEQSILYWLEALSLLGKMQESVLMLSTLPTIAQVSSLPRDYLVMSNIRYSLGTIED